ncbi:MAG: polysaccharide lyase [Hyphomicrobiaceae bacterium]
MKSKLPGKRVLAFNGAALLVVGVSAIAMIRSSFYDPDAEPCADRYVNGIRMALTGSDGAPLAAGELQGQLSDTDWGLMDNIQVVKLRSGPAKAALQVKLPPLPAAGHDNADERAGAGFYWEPEAIRRPQAACLVYSVYVPKGFKFGQGMRLPGLMGNDAIKQDPQTAGAKRRKPEFSARYVFDQQGNADIFAQLPGVQQGRSLGGRESGFGLPHGRWVKFEQEVVLNTPGKKDGSIIAWVDGKLQFKKKGIMARQNDTTTIVGVLAEVTPGVRKADAMSGPEKIWMSPFELRWN